MSLKLIFFILFFILQAITWGQDSNLRDDQKKVVRELINIIKTKNKTLIAERINYPLGREYPLRNIKTKNEFIQRFDEIFDEQFIDHISKSKIGDWAEVGWRGIMLDNGSLWIDDNGKITGINNQTAKEAQLLKAAIQADKDKLPLSLQDFEKPMYLIVTKNYKIRIDEKINGKLRYASWKNKYDKTEPDLVIENGVLEFQGSGGNHTITFNNNGYTYVISVNIIGSEEESDLSLTVLKGEKEILSEAGEIIIN